MFKHFIKSSPFHKSTSYTANGIRRRSYATYKTFNNSSPTYSNLIWQSRYYIGGATVLGSIFYFSHLEPAPISGRKRFIFVSESVERYFGMMTYNQVMSQYKCQILPQHHPLTIKVKKIMKRLIDASTIKDDSIKWEIYVIDSDDPPNAFVIPGGKVFVFKSILAPIAKNDDGLATILSHEFSHQLARHSAENLSKAPIYSLLNFFLYALTGSSFLNNLLLQTTLQMPASREMETEADYIGLMLMSKACFDPHEASKVWKRFSDYERTHAGGTYEFLSTHPSSERRLHNMDSWLHEAEMQRELGNCDNMGGWFSDFKTATGSTNVFGIDTSRRGGDNGGLW